MKVKVINYGYEKLPNRAHYNDAGADVYACLDYNVVISPGDTRKIPLGLGLVLPDGFMACIYPRSGLATDGIVCELPPVDSGYRGEIHAIVHNGGNKSFTVKNGDRIGQLVITPVIMADFVEDLPENRGAAGFGSTGI